MVTYTQQNAVSSLNVYANVNSTNYLLKSYELDGKYVGDAVTVTCPQYYLLDGTLYSTANHGSGGYFKWSHTLTGSDLEITYGTTAATNVVYYVEAENISGATANSGNNADIRCSEAAGAYFGSETNIVTLSAGSYTIYTQVWGGAGTTFTFKAGEETIREHTTTGALNPGNSSFTIAESKTITVSASGSNGKVLDLIYIVKTGEVVTIGSTGWATFCNPWNLDFSETGATVYTAKANDEDKTVTLSAVTGGQVPANTGFILYKAGGGDITPTVIASATAFTGDNAANELVGVTSEQTIEYNPSNGVYNYIFQNQTSGDGLGFYKATNKKLHENRAYLSTSVAAPTSAPSMNIVIDNGDGNTTSISEAFNEKSEFINDGVYYNLAGQRVTQPTKGLYIVNGRKVVIK